MNKDDKKVHKAEVIKPGMHNEDHYVKPPSFFQMVKTFTKELVTYIANGSPNVITEDYISRLETCESCDHFIMKSARCGKCGCLMEHKAKMKTSDCPLGKWEKQFLTPEQEETFKKHEAAREKARTSNKDKGSVAKVSSNYIEYTPEEMKKLKEEHAKRQKDNNTDSSNKI